jgi:hypothetical protein
MKAEDAKRLKELERENTLLKKIVADQLVDIDMHKELNREIGEPGPSSPRRDGAARPVRVSERRACRVVGLHRSAQRRRPRPASDADTLLRQISAAHPRWDGARPTPSPPGKVWWSTANATHRLWLELGLKRPPRVRKQRRSGPARHLRMRAIGPDQMWALDFQVDVTVDSRQVRFCNIIDEYTREALAAQAARSFTADATVAVLDRLVTTLGRRPQHVRMDNGPELTAHALTDWCRFTGVDPAYIDPGSPW